MAEITIQKEEVKTETNPAIDAVQGTEQEELMRRIFREEIAKFMLSDRFFFNRDLKLQDGTNIIFASGVGTKIGTATTQKLAFFGTTPAAQQASIADPSGGGTIDTQARTAINSILDVLDVYGLTA